MSHEKFDVIVVGAGPAGSTTASLLAQRGLEVLLLDKSDFPRDKTCGDALSPRALKVLQRMGLLTAVSQTANRISDLQVTGPDGASVTVAIPQQPGYPQYSFVIKRFALDHLLQQHAIEVGARFQGGFHIHQIGPAPDKVVVTGGPPGQRQRFQAQVVVLAVGANMGLLQKLNLLPNQPDVSLAARGYFEGIEAPNQRLQFRFDGIPLPGYGWIFPLANGQANIGAGFSQEAASSYTNPAEALEAFLAHPPIQLQLGGGRLVGSIKGYPLRTDFHRSPTHRGRLLLVGEAAGLVNPFTGEGIDYALESAELAAAALCETFEGRLGLKPSLVNYDRSLRQRFQETFVLTHWLRRIYMRPALLDPLIGACQRRPELGRRLVRIMLAYDSPRLALTPGFFLRVLWSAVRPNGVG